MITVDERMILDLSRIADEIRAKKIDQLSIAEQMSDIEDELQLLEAHHMLTVEGKNEAERKARLALALAGDPEVRRLRATLREHERNFKMHEIEISDLRRRFAIAMARTQTQFPLNGL
ncbi:MAG: hypothetical protein C4321_00350 [Chloroflexota bacterium]